MRDLACILLLALLGAGGCSGGVEGPRGAATGGGTAGAGTGVSGGPAMPAGGSTSSVAGSASTGGMPVTSGGAPVTTAGSTGQGGAPPVTGGNDGKSHVITWVPPYHRDEAKQQLAANFGGTGMADGLSYLALQFWITDGAATRLDQVSEADITWFHDWARQHGVKLLLCVDNNTGDWDWPAAVRSFKDNRDAFAQHLVSQVMSRDFDGVDLDLEGIIAPTADDQQSYTQFVQTLTSALHPLGKVVTLDSFYAQYNAPNWDWWPDLLPLVDGITSMGYEQSSLDVDYQKLVDHAAAAPKKLMVGVPSYQGTWQNHTVTEQLAWLLQQGQVGTAIWDASLMAPEWQQAGVWNQLKAIKSR
jgi:Glycosyl hydrolases family 18